MKTVSLVEDDAALCHGRLGWLHLKNDGMCRMRYEVVQPFAANALTTQFGHGCEVFHISKTGEGPVGQETGKLALPLPLLNTERPFGICQSDPRLEVTALILRESIKIEFLGSWGWSHGYRWLVRKDSRVIVRTT